MCFSLKTLQNGLNFTNNTKKKKKPEFFKKTTLIFAVVAVFLFQFF